MANEITARQRHQCSRGQEGAFLPKEEDKREREERALADCAHAHLQRGRGVYERPDNWLIWQRDLHDNEPEEETDFCSRDKERAGGELASTVVSSSNRQSHSDERAAYAK